MISKGVLELHIFEAVFANVQLGLLAVLVRVRAEVPGVDFVLAELNFVNVLHFCELLVLFFQNGNVRV
jgi:hypothetical protein